jgi:hypothetical protein
MIKDIFYSARPKYWAWLFVAMFMLLLTKCAYAQTLPSGYIGRVQNNTANQWATYTFTFTPSVSGSQYIMFAFRQDPAYWYFDNARLTVQGQTTNLLTNANFATGGSLSVNTANYGTLNINAPTAWGVGYQSGIYPSAAGTWSNGQWIDGAVGSFDSIYQAVTLTAGTTYVITFDAMSNNTVDNNAVQLGVYAGQCSNLSMAPANCSLPSTSGFETVASPSLTYTTGCTTDCPPPPGPAPNPRPTWPVINRPVASIGFGTNRTTGWSMTGYWTGVWGSINFSQGLMPNGAWTRGTSYMRWPGTDNGVSKTISFRVGYDDYHELKINGQTVVAGGCCAWHYGSYTAKPGEIVKLEFYTNNDGGYDWVFQVAWDPQGDGTYELLDSNTVAVQSTVDGGGSYWYSSDITTDQLNIMSVARTRRDAVVLGNRIDFEEKIGSSGNNVTIEQTGNYNLIQGLGGGNAILDGDTNTLNIRQGDTPAGRNLIELGVYGNSNNVTITQARNTDTGLRDAAESGRHYAGLGINGDSNTVTIRQGNQGAANSGHFGLMYIKGNSNNMTLKQAHDGEKRAFISVDGNNNSSLISQGGTGNQYLDLMMAGNGHTANITQTGAGSHRATINLTNAGGSSILNLTQQGTTSQQYSIVQQCANLSGCSVTVTQGGP